MYSMVLMMAMTTSVDIPEAGRRGGGCGGCQGGCMGACYGGGGGGRSKGGRKGGGGGCCGCYGGYAYGGCYGYGYSCGCYGGGYAYGGCMGYGYGGCMGMGHGYGGCYGGGMMMPGTQPQPGAGEKLKTSPTPKKTGVFGPAPATIVVELAADAKLLIDNELTTSTGASRVFVSPDLNPGQEYHYTLKAELVRDGKPVRVEKVVAVKAGETTSVPLNEPAVGVAQRVSFDGIRNEACGANPRIRPVSLRRREISFKTPRPARAGRSPTDRVRRW